MVPSTTNCVLVILLERSGLVTNIILHKKKIVIVVPLTNRDRCGANVPQRDSLKTNNWYVLRASCHY